MQQDQQEEQPRKAPAESAAGALDPGPVGRNRWRWVAVATVVLLVLLVPVGNAALSWYVRADVLRVLRCVTGDDSVDPAVSLGGGPVLLDLPGREIGEITVSGLPPAAVEQVSAARSTDPAVAAAVADADLTLILRGVSLRDPGVLRSAEATVHLPWQGVNAALESASSSAADELAGATLGEQDGLLAVTPAQEVAGQPVTVLVALEPEAQALTATVRSVVVGGQTIGVGLISLLAGDLLEKFGGADQLQPRTVDLGLPAGMELTTVIVRSDGLDLALTIDPAQIAKSMPEAGACLA